jgi:DNA-binding HxlR family transcriptional regulator
MTTQNSSEEKETCPAQSLLKLLAGKWKAEIYRLAVDGPVRFNGLLRSLEGSNKQSISMALKELEEAGLLSKTTVQEKPLHIEYHLTEKGKSLVPVMQQLGELGTST